MLHLLNFKSTYEEYQQAYKYYFSKEFRKLEFTGVMFKKPFSDDAKVINLDYTDNQYLLCGYSNSGMSLFDVNYPKKCIVKSKKTKVKGWISSIDWYHVDTGMFVTGSSDKTLKIWDTNEFAVAEEIKFYHPILDVKFGNIPNNSLISVITDDKVLDLVDVRISRKFRQFVGHERCLRCQSWSPINPNIICTAGEDCTIRVWDIRKPGNISQLYIFNQHLYTPLDKSFYKRDEGYNQRILKTNNKSHSSSINKILISTDGHILYSINNTGTEIHKWDLYSGNRIDIIYPKVVIDSVIQEYYGIPLDMINNYDNDDYIVIGSHSIIRIINLNNPNDEIQLKGHMGSVNSIAVRQNHCEIYSSAFDNMILKWSPKLNDEDDTEEEEEKKEEED